MKTRLRLLIAITIFTAAGACEERAETPPPSLAFTVTDGSYVNCYQIADSFDLINNTNAPSATKRVMIIDPHEQTRCYSQWILSYYLPNNPQHDVFDRIAHRNQDTGFTGEIWGSMHTCFSINFSDISIACNLDWDEAHSAGVPLDDLCDLIFTPYGLFIQNGYLGEAPDPIRKRMSDVTPEELYIIDEPFINLTIPDQLMGKSIQFTVTMTDTQGKEYKCSYTLKSEK